MIARRQLPASRFVQPAELLVLGQATKQAVEVGLGIAPVEGNGGLLVAVLEGQ